MKKELWMIFEQDNQQMPLLTSSADKLGLDYETKYIEHLTAESGKLFYDGEVITDLPKVVLMRAYVDGQEKIHSYLEDNGVRVIDGWSTVQLINDKAKTHEALEKHGIKQPRFLTASQDKLTYKSVSEKLGTPFIAKDSHGQCGSGVFLVSTPDEYKRALDELSGAAILFQEYIKESAGRDLRTYVIGDCVVPTGIVRDNTGSLVSNVAAGGTISKVELTPEQIAQSLKIAKILNGELISVDYLMKGDELYFCEANTNAGGKGFFDLVTDKMMQYVRSILI